MSKKKKIEIWDLLTEEANKQIDELGYAFLAEHGYDVSEANVSKAKRHDINEALKANGEELRHGVLVDTDTNKILFWFELHRNGEMVARSRAIQFVTVKGDADGEGTSQTGSAPSA